MKTGRTLQELAIELQRQSNAKEDLVAPAAYVSMDQTGKRLSIDCNNKDGSEEIKSYNNIDDTAHNQIGTFLNIPKKYYEKMREQDPELLSHNVNKWLNKSDKTRMIRTMDNKVRAFLSDRYRRIDNDQVADMALNTLLNMPLIGDNNIASCEVTDKKLYIKVVFHHIKGEVKVGDNVESGITITNSEIGLGGFNVMPFVYRLICLNGMTVNDAAINKRHLGTRLDCGMIDYQDDTVKADDKALMLELRDTILASGNQETFNKYIDKMKEATTGEQISKPTQAVEVLSKTYGFNENEKLSILENLIRNRDYSKWGALNAVTETANNLDNYDRASEFESIGGQILTLNNSQWNEISQAA